MAFIFTDVGVRRAELLTPPAGYGWIKVADIPWAPDSRSVLEEADPAARVNDVIEWGLTTSPSGYAVTMRADGTFALVTDDRITQQTFPYRLWRFDPFRAWYGPETVTLEGEVIGIPTSSAGGRAFGFGLEPLPEGDTGNWIYTETGVLENELRAFMGLGRSKSAGVGTGLGETPFLGIGLGASTSAGTGTGLGLEPETGFGLGFSSSGGRASGTGFSAPPGWPWTTIHKTDTVWIKIK